MVSELVDDLCQLNPLAVAFGLDGPLSTHYRRDQFFKTHLSLTEPVEYILDSREKKTFQYVPILSPHQGAIEKKFPKAVTVNMTNKVSILGTTYCVGMLLPFGSMGGLPDFGEILQILIVHESPIFVLRLLIKWEFALLYEDKDFGNQFFSVISSADLYDKATVKLVRKEPLITLNMLPVESGPSSAQVLCTNSVDIFPGDSSEADPVDDSEADTSLASTSSQGSSMFPESCRSAPWPVSFQVPQFSRDVELILAEANKIHHDSGIHFSDASVKSAIMQDLAKAIFSYTAYPSTLQISSVADALVEKFPCLKEPGSFQGCMGGNNA
ncbi:hypothetical protein F7725_002741 [Dissostichus mawsoni]|uniref:Uncharacterized protein n=1 Tax=Dissostichus mawsoni TaxID=36200 RepID=A0A7J5Y934_DISMA|nr:hypothetical protein F7725_002741 [Dissostichus mawsoni]